MSDPTKRKINYGRDFNFFKKLNVLSSTFNEECDIFINFVTQGIMLLNLGTGTIEYSFNGIIVHGELNSSNPSVGKVFDNRVVSKIWFRVATGSSGPISISVEAWSIQ